MNREYEPFAKHLAGRSYIIIRSDRCGGDEEGKKPHVYIICMLESYMFESDVKISAISPPFRVT
jgi:hypothetical protein